MDIYSQEDYDRAERYRQDHMGRFWLGANDLQTQGSWVWESSQEEVSLNEFWWVNRPANDIDFRCVALRNFGMFDYECTRLFPSVCKVRFMSFK